MAKVIEHREDHQVADRLLERLLRGLYHYDQKVTAVGELEGFDLDHFVVEWQVDVSRAKILVLRGVDII